MVFAGQGSWSRGFGGGGGGEGVGRFVLGEGSLMPGDDLLGRRSSRGGNVLGWCIE